MVQSGTVGTRDGSVPTSRIDRRRVVARRILAAARAALSADSPLELVLAEDAATEQTSAVRVVVRGPDGREYRTRPLVRVEELVGGKYQAADRTRYAVVPVRFVRACKKGHIDENCSFLKSTADYASQKDEKRRGVLAEQIMHFYLGKEAKQEINLPALKAERLTVAYTAAKSAKKYPTGMFAEAVSEITSLLVTNINQNNRATFAPVLAALK